MAVLFLDRDGVVNTFPGRGRYILHWEDFHFLSGSLEALAELTRAGHRLFLVSNQSAVGRGLLSAWQLQQMTQRMLQIIEAHGGRIEEVRYCLHRPEAGCVCRKPKIGLFTSILQQHQALAQQPRIMIGDSQADIIAGRTAGCQTILVLTGEATEAEWPAWSVRPEAVRPDLRACVELVEHIVNGRHVPERSSADTRSKAAAVRTIPAGNQPHGT